MFFLSVDILETVLVYLIRTLSKSEHLGGCFHKFGSQCRYAINGSTDTLAHGHCRIKGTTNFYKSMNPKFDDKITDINPVDLNDVKVDIVIDENHNTPIVTRREYVDPILDKEQKETPKPIKIDTPIVTKPVDNITKKEVEIDRDVLLSMTGSLEKNALKFDHMDKGFYCYKFCRDTFCSSCNSPHSRGSEVILAVDKNKRCAKLCVETGKTTTLGKYRK